MLPGLRKFNFEEEAQKVYSIIKKWGLVLIPTQVNYGLLGHSAESIKKKIKIEAQTSK